ncbi:hypothetical protein L596_025797 [Steinernema carpocapsae]|uniref:Uncharacterized protein n=1 Tax=Steinernema carpocapsae TaxID=34508 RepID=A0A4U5M8T6_STECR|nr:hypothetical protein L596_025797 [Steinernema carpocapsae]
MSKPKPKMPQEAIPSLLSPLFERSSLEPTTPAARRLRRKNHIEKLPKKGHTQPSTPSFETHMSGFTCFCRGVKLEEVLGRSQGRFSAAPNTDFWSPSIRSTSVKASRLKPPSAKTPTQPKLDFLHCPNPTLSSVRRSPNRPTSRG